MRGGYVEDQGSVGKDVGHERTVGKDTNTSGGSVGSAVYGAIERVNAHEEFAADTGEIQGWRRATGARSRADVSS